MMDAAKQKVVLEWANKIRAGRNRRSAREVHENDSIGDEAAQTLRMARALVDDAIRTWQRRTAPPAIPRTEVVEVHRDDLSQPVATEQVTLTRKTAVAAITDADRREWLKLILQAVADASVARAQADNLALQSVT